jgi:hypothetical protein
MIDPDTGRDPALYPVGSDEWDTGECGKITINGVIWGKTKKGTAEPFVFFRASSNNWAVSPFAWRKLMRDATLIRSAEDRIRHAGAEMPKWSGPP